MVDIIKHPEFGARVREAMREKNIKRPELARRLGHNNPEMIRRYELGAAVPRGENLRRLAESLGVSTDYLLYGQAPPVHDTTLELLEQALTAVEQYTKQHGVNLPARAQLRAALEIAEEMRKGQKITDVDIGTVFLKMIA